MNFFADALPAHWHRVPAILATSPFGVNESMLAHPLTGPSLRNYLLLSHSRDLLNELSEPAEDVFWSRYYWFVRFSQTQQALFGADVSLVQMAHQIFEYPQPECSPDWSMGESVEPLAKNDAIADVE